jgi:hypothetical protein
VAAAWVPVGSVPGAGNLTSALSVLGMEHSSGHYGYVVVKPWLDTGAKF